jgi:hypothetical protein
MTKSERSAFTIAVGKQSFKNMAVNLARSIAHNAPETSFTIITDEFLKLPFRSPRISQRLVKPGSLGRGFSTKLHLDRLAPTKRSMFIDADCLVYRPLDDLFDAFAGLPVGVLGHNRTDGELFCDVISTCRRFNVKSLPWFNGGVYYIESGNQASKVYDRAREIEKHYDEFGFVRLRGQPNEEILMSVALAEHGISPVPNPGCYYADFQWWPGDAKLNVLRGHSLMVNPPSPDPRRQTTFPADFANPIVVHFLGHHVESIIYKREAVALRLNNHLPMAGLLARIAVSPLCLNERSRELLRPVYRSLFGIRKIKSSKSRFVVDE